MKNKILLIVLALSFTACASNHSPKQCLEVPNSGMCKVLFIKYYFDSKDGQCKKFAWGGCGGNIPFETLKECKSTCEK